MTDLQGRLSIDPCRPSSVFVYGTLKRGESREQAWPLTPQRVSRARIKAQLYDLGRYPAIVRGDDWVLGECWEFLPRDITATLDVLDQIEGYQNSAGDLYRRLIVPCWDCWQLDRGPDSQPGQTEAPEESSSPDNQAGVFVYAYFFAHADHLKRVADRVMPTDGVCRWPGS